MMNPIMRELVAREQYNDLLREAEQIRLAETAATHEAAGHFNLRITMSHILSAVRYRFKVLAHAK